ncbi:MAG: hypothetical protein ACUZ8H_09575 [Candidatus Anammoxibacter sp.]
MKSIKDKVIDTVNDNVAFFEKNDNYQDLKDALEKYNEMLSSGITKKRGYNLLSVDQSNINQPSFTVL